MSKRHAMSRGHSKRNFRHHAMHTHRKNLLSGSSAVMRGGIRL